MTDVPLFMNQFNRKQIVNTNLRQNYQPNANTQILPVGSNIRIAIGSNTHNLQSYENDILYFFDAETYLVYKLRPDFMHKIADGDRFYLWSSKSDIHHNPVKTHNHNSQSHDIVMARLLQDVIYWYIFSNNVYNYIVVFIAIIIVICIIFGIYKLAS